MEVVTIPIDKIRISPLNIRAGDQFGDDEDLELEKNVESMGLIQPIVVRPVGDSYEVIVGRRRFLSVQNSGAEEITCVVKEFDDEEALDFSLSENVLRKNVDPVTLGRWLKARLDRGDMSLSEYARRIGKSKSTLSEWLRMNDLSEELQRKVADGAIPFRYALKIARMDLSPEEQGTLSMEEETGGYDALEKAVDRIAAGREKRGAPRGLQVVRINFGQESSEYDTLRRMAESKGMKLSDYCEEILLEHVRASNA
jgi:ParB/RepB/Spo0J family partition protein